jgi:glycosyltransferase involved in cell wall biosynthesis
MRKKSVSILIWNPLLSPGGGAKLLEKLVRSLADSPSVIEIGLALSKTTQPLEQEFQKINKLRVFYIPRHFSHILLAPFGKDLNSMAYRSVNFLRRLLFSSMENKAISGYLRSISKDYNILYCPWPHHIDFPKVDIPVFCTFQDTILLDFPEILGGAETLREKHRSQIWLRNSSRVIISSNSTKNALERQFPESNTNFEMIRHAIPSELSQISTEIHEKWISLLPEKYFVCLSNINSHKNLRNILYAWSQFAFRDKYPLVLVGYGTQILMPDWGFEANVHWQQDELLGIIMRTGLKRGKEIVGYGYVSDSDVAAILNNAIGLIMPSLAEGGGSYPVAEALSLGIPVLCSDIPVMHEQLDNKQGVIWFNPLSVDSIVNAVNYFLSNYSEIKEKLRHNTPEGLTWDMIADQYLQVFTQTK